MTDDEKARTSPESKALDKLTAQIRATTERLSDVSDSIKVIPSIEAYGKKTRKLTIGMIVGWVLDIALTIIVAVGLVTTSSQANQLRTVQYNACVAGNAKNAQEIQVLHKLFDLTGSSVKQPGETEAQFEKTQTRLNEFYAYLDKTYAPVNCTKRYS
jgi:hypothetical protein